MHSGIVTVTAQCSVPGAQTPTTSVSIVTAEQCSSAVDEADIRSGHAESRLQMCQHPGLTNYLSITVEMGGSSMEVGETAIIEVTSGDAFHLRASVGAETASDIAEDRKEHCSMQGDGRAGWSGSRDPSLLEATEDTGGAEKS